MIYHFGVLLPSTNTTVEIEFTRLLPPELQPHYARLGKQQNTAFAPSRSDDLSYQSKMLGNAKVSVIGLIQTSASLFEENYDADAKRRMTENANAPAVTSAEAIGEAVQALGGSRIALVSPYSEEVIALAKRYYETRYGIDVAATHAFGATDSYEIGNLGAENATEAFTKIDLDSVDVLVVPGGNFPTMQHIAAWEDRFAKPVVTTNQAVLWSMMAKMNCGISLPGLGRLLA